MLQMFSQNVALQEALKTATRINKELKNMIHQKKKRGPRSLNPGEAIAMAICQKIVLVYYLDRARCMTWRVTLRAQ